MNRLKKYGILTIIKSWSFWIPLILAIVSFFLDIWMIPEENVLRFISTGRNVSLALGGMILTGLVILISISDKEFLNFLRESDAYDKLFFLFEYNTVLVVLIILVSMYVGLFGVTDVRFHLFIFLFVHLVLSFLRLISGVISFGEKKGQFETINGLDEENLRENSEIPDRLLKEEFRSEENADSDEETEKDI
ncbi:hypothetical protein GLW36_16170 [Halorubrum terrestre]|uniref:Uncharacterized protein n=1 Tax=Halorubrum distributum TaxID=29283 RepID=A0A6B1IG28_9EURY|nr:hypothetical protein [Halorubrum terrestre]MYL18167.1 hypothetical protein [Halorubrum terrestre]